MAHMKGAALVCPVCGKEFVGKHRLRNHTVQKHPKGQEFATCEYCQKVPVPTCKMIFFFHGVAGYNGLVRYLADGFYSQAT